MRYNKHELFALASQTSQNFDREGVIILKERQDSFFRRSDGYFARWFRLRGNLLFYLKGPEPWYEPLGLIVLGNHQVSVQNQDENGHWPFQLVWENGACYRMGTFFESERTLWLKAMTSAPYQHLQQTIVDLQRQLNDTRTMIDLKKYRSMNKIIQDFNEVPLCELSLSCDNLLCDAYGNPPSPFAAVFVLFSNEGVCVRYGSTEVVEKCSNPNFLRTVMFRKSDGIKTDMMIRIVIYNMREITTQTGVPIGSVAMRLSHIQEAQRFRAPLLTTDNRVVGYVTFNGWSLERAPSGTIPTAHANPEAHSATSPTLMNNSIDLTPKLPAHRRSQSLPPRIGLKFHYPEFEMMIHENFLNPHQATYHFHSGLGGDIIVQEALAEPNFCFTMPLQLLEIFITREEELMDAILVFPGAQEHAILHINLIKELKTARDNMLSHSVCFKPSVQKISEIAEEPALAYAPVNLHLQRLWSNNDSLNKKGFHDTITVGAFTAHSQTADKPGGLIKLLKQSKDISSRKAEMTANSNRLEAEFEKLRAMKSLNKILIAHMNSVLLLLKNGLFLDTRKSMAAIRENVKMILDMWDIKAIEEALSKVGWDKGQIDKEDLERKQADNVALRPLRTKPGGNAHRSACAAAAIATVAALSIPTNVDRAGVTSSIEAIVNGMKRIRTAAGVAAGGLVKLHPAIPKTDDGAKTYANRLAVTTTDAAKLAPANADRAVVFAVVRTRSEGNLRRTLGLFSANPTPAASRSLSESDLRNTSEHNVVNKNDSPKCDKNGKNTENGVEAIFTSTSHVNAAGTSGDSAPEKVESTSGSTAAGDKEEQMTAISRMIDEELAASSSGVNAAGTSGESAPEKVESTSGSTAAGDKEEQMTAISRMIDEELAASSSGVNAAGTSGESAPEKVESTSGSTAAGDKEEQMTAISRMIDEELAASSSGVNAAGTSGESAPEKVESTSGSTAAGDKEEQMTAISRMIDEELAASSSGVNAAGTSGESAPEKVESTSGSTAAGDKEEQMTAISRMIDEELAASSSGVNAAGTSGESAPEKVESTSGSTAAGDKEEQMTAISRMIDEELAASSSGVNAAGTSGESAPEKVESTSGSTAAGDKEEQMTAISRMIDEELAASSSGVNAAGTSGESAPEKVESTSGSTAAGDKEEQMTAISRMIDEELAASSSGLSAAGTSGSTASVQNASRPHTSGKSKRRQPRGCKHNRAPKLTKQARKEANREALRLTPGGQARMAETAQSERLFNRRADFNSATALEQLALSDLLFRNNKGSTKKTKRNRREPAVVNPDPAVRYQNQKAVSMLHDSVCEMMNRLYTKLNNIFLKGYVTAYDFEDHRLTMELIIELLEDIQRWTRMAYSAMRINTEPPTWRSEYTLLRTRRDICFSQALTAAAAGVLCWAATTPGEIVAKIVQSGLGPLLGFEGLLSLYADETTMWGDMVIAVEDLHTLTFKFVTVSPGGPFVPQVTGSRSALIIEIPITYSLYHEFHNAAVSPTFTVTAVFFNIGINDKAFTAESLGDNKPQYQSNKDNFGKLFKYYHKYCQQFPQDPFEQFRASSRSKPLEEVMENLRSAVLRRSPKDVEVLQLAAQATRLMHGVRFTSCKSAKDRTGMAVTLEQANILSNEYHLADDERKLALDVMRSEGCRRDNATKNTGQRKYAFSKPQVMALPEEYRPPLGSYGSIERGYNR